MPAYEQVIPLSLQQYSPEEAKKVHIALARQGLAQFLARQQEIPDYSIVVDGRPAASEDAVKPFGVISYVFNRLRPAAMFALQQAREQSPVRSGRYKQSWFLMVDGGEVATVPAGAREVILTNDQPYARKIMVRGARFAGVPPGIVERVRQLVQRRYKSVVCEVRYISLAGAYQLKRQGRRRSQRPGRAISYPALVISQRAAV